MKLDMDALVTLALSLSAPFGHPHPTMPPFPERSQAKKPPRQAFTDAELVERDLMRVAGTAPAANVVFHASHTPAAVRARGAGTFRCARCLVDADHAARLLSCLGDIYPGLDGALVEAEIRRREKAARNRQRRG